MMTGAPPEAVDMVRLMLEFNPKTRMTIEQARCHPWSPRRISRMRRYGLRRVCHVTARPAFRQALAHPFMKPFTTGMEAKAPGTLRIPIDDDIKYSVSDYRDKLYQLVRARILTGLSSRARRRMLR